MPCTCGEVEGPDHKAWCEWAENPKEVELPPRAMTAEEAAAFKVFKAATFRKRAGALKEEEMAHTKEFYHEWCQEEIARLTAEVGKLKRFEAIIQELSHTLGSAMELRGDGTFTLAGAVQERFNQLTAELATARADEREACCFDVCGGCRFGLKLVQTWTHGGAPYELWMHIDRALTTTPCAAAGIRQRGAMSNGQREVPT